MDVCSSYKYSSDIGLERLSYQSKLIFIDIQQNMSIIINGESETCPISEIAMIILSLKFICFSHLAALVCFLAVVPFVAFPILLQQLHDKNERQKKFTPL